MSEKSELEHPTDRQQAIKGKKVLSKSEIMKGPKAEIKVPWGVNKDWSLMLSPMLVGLNEEKTRTDNAVLYYELKTDFYDRPEMNTFKVKALNLFKNGPAESQIEFRATKFNYLLVCK